MAVQCWPWGDGDTLELGNVVRPSGSEVNNGHDLIRQADFTPSVVTYLPFMQAYIGEASTGSLRWKDRSF